jgi:hypothetical protein
MFKLSPNKSPLSFMVAWSVFLVIMTVFTALVSYTTSYGKLASIIFEALLLLSIPLMAYCYIVWLWKGPDPAIDYRMMKWNKMKLGHHHLLVDPKGEYLSMPFSYPLVDPEMLEIYGSLAYVDSIRRVLKDLQELRLELWDDWGWRD